MKKRLAAAALAALIGFVFLFGQGPVQKVRLWDTDLSHSLLFQWNENDNAARTLNFLVDGASRSLSIFGDTWVEQDYRIAATPTFAGLYLESSTAAPFLKMTNESNTARDPITQLAVGATPVTKWTYGLDDSEDDNWKLANAASLGTTTTISYRWGDTLYYTHGADHSIIGVQLSDFTTDAVFIVGGAGSGDGQFNNPRQIAYDGTYVYVADDLNDRVQKFLASSGIFVSKTLNNVSRPWGIVYWDGYIYVSCSSGTYGATVRKFDANTLVFQSGFGSYGVGNNNFNGVHSMTTDGIYLYICDYGNDRVKKHTLSGTYVDQVGSYGTGNGQFNGPAGIATNGTNLYVCDYANKRVQIFLCSTLAYVGQIAMPDRTGSGPGYPSSITLNGTYWYVGVNDSNPFNGYHIKYDIATNSFQAYYDCSYGAGSNPDTIWGSIILKDEVSHGDLIVIHEDGQFIDLYPKTRFFDSVRLYEGALATGEYVGLRAPLDVTASYHFTLPATVNTAKNHVYAATGGILGFGQNVDTDGSPTFANITDSGLTATHPVFTDANKVLVSTGTMPVDHGGTGLASYAVGDLLYASAGTTLSKLVDVAAGSYLRSGGITTAPLWSTLVLPNAATAYRLPVATSANTIGELAAVGATGQYLSGVTGAIPTWANISAFEPALGNPDIDGKVLSSTVAGVRSWIAAGGALAVDDLTDVNAPAPADNDILRFDTASGDWMNEALPAGGAHDALSATHTDTLASAVSRGSIIYGNSTPKWAELAVGTVGKVLTTDGTDVMWDDPPAAAAHAILSATHNDTTAAAVQRGDMITGSGASPTWARLAKGTAGYVLTMGADEPAWAQSPGASVTSLLPFYAQGWKWGFFINGSAYKEDLADWSVSGASPVYSRDANGDWLRCATGATAGNTAYLAGSGYAITQMNQNFSVIFRIKTAANIANMRLWVGMGSANRAANNDTAAGSFVGVMYSSATSANWYTVTRDGTDQGQNDSALAVAADTCYVIKIVITGGGTAKIYINGTLYSTTTTYVPAAATGLDGYVWWYTNEAVLKQVYFGYYYGEAIFSQTG